MTLAMRGKTPAGLLANWRR